MRKLLTLFVFIVVSVTLAAQVDYSFGNVKHKRDKSSVPTIGIKGGLTSYNMHFAYETYNKIPNDMVLKPGFGIFVEYPFKRF